MKNYDITKAKLIIWDMDDTFWKGSVCEEQITFIPQNIDFVKELTTKGIMNSICSKNNYDTVRNEFCKNNLTEIWDLFVFNSIEYSPKGKRVKDIITNMNLREENVIFIDDNPNNINEVKFYSPRIMTATPNEIKKMAQELYLVNDYDFEHTRLMQYKILEEKFSAHKDCSNEDFLEASNIKICIKKDCLNQLERIEKLIERTNQLNFTKFRDKDIRKTIVENESAYIIVEDKFGNYGICGFYSIDKSRNRLIHFLFSCRIMNMGVEQYIYSMLNKPKLEIVGEIASHLDYEPDWITEVDNLEVQTNTPKLETDVNILLKGPCDLYSTLGYINSDCNIDTEFPYWNKNLIYVLAHTHTAFIEQTHKFSEEKIKEITNRFPFPSPDEFKSEFFNPKYNLIFLSLLTTTHSGLYINKKDGSYVLFGYANCDITDENNWEKLLAPLPEEAKNTNLEMLKVFKNDYTFAGNPPCDTIINNLKYIKEHLAPHTKLVLILGSEIPTQKVQAGYENMAEKHKILNQKVRNFAKNNNIEIIEITELIKSDKDYTTCINHFSRKVSLKLAQKIIEASNMHLGKRRLELRIPL